MLVNQNNEIAPPRASIEIRSPDGGTSELRVCIQGLAGDRVSFLHRGFLYPGSACTLKPAATTTTLNSTIGHIADCRRRSAGAYEYVVALESAIDIPPSGSGHLDREQLRGCVLVIDGSVANTALARELLKGTEIELLHAETIAEAYVTTRSQQVDVLIVALGALGMSPAALIDSFRAAGFEGPIVFATAEPDGATASAALTAGAAEILALPMRGPSVRRVLGGCLRQRSSSRDPIHSRLAPAPGAIELVENYIEHVRTLVDDLRQAAESGDLGALQCHLAWIARSAGGYGFPALAEAAKRYEAALADTDSIRDALAEHRGLLRICERLAPMSLP